ncbi:hypothetical protein EMPG_12122 [Blastomyces silverae]|uniref:Uncharacterized protein n=1 Tax=Blastomyces silverae TaxID=2060906 RepID=A0A0H1BV22_9EURO|nr:hypothetical protein EMPG_12122 [Blastomyces silverae]
MTPNTAKTCLSLSGTKSLVRTFNSLIDIHSCCRSIEDLQEQEKDLEELKASKFTKNNES